MQERFAATAGDAVVAIAVQGERVNETLSDRLKAFEDTVLEQSRDAALTLSARGEQIAKGLGDHLQLFERSMLRDGGALTDRIDHMRRSCRRGSARASARSTK